MTESQSWWLIGLVVFFGGSTIGYLASIARWIEIVAGRLADIEQSLANRMPEKWHD